MIEVLFGESEAGSMKCAKSLKNVLNRTDGPTMVWGDASLIPPQPEEWEAVPGTPDEVICFNYLLDVGNIQEPFDSAYRDQLIFSMYTQSGWEESEEYLEGLKEDIRRQRQAYDRFRAFLEKGEDIRIWYSTAAYSMCGLYWLCNILGNAGNRVYVVKLPEYQETGAGTIIHFRSWGEVSAEQFASFLPLQRELSLHVRRMYGNCWTELVEDNSPLRAVVNGELVGVPENFYDYLIRKEITESPVKEARLIGNILGKYPVMVSDWWYAARIEKLLEKGEIQILQDSSRKYARMIRLAEGEM